MIDWFVVYLHRDAVFGRYSRLKQQSKQRIKKLHDSRKLQQFLQEMTEVSIISWVSNLIKLHVYIDPGILKSLQLCEIK